jgi:agmatine deiminase
VQASIALIANTIARHEPVVLLAAAKHHATARKLLTADVELWDVATDDLWCRDSGPTFVKNDAGELAVAHFRFNGWGDKQPHANDALIAERVAERLGLPLLDTGLVGEQGGVEHDGAGTLLAHASCWANPNRNNLSEDEIGKRLLAALGGEKMIWAPGIAGKDITDYHIDALARFVAPGKVLIQLSEEIDPDDPWSVSGHETLEILLSATDALGRRLEIIRLPDPVNIRSHKADFVSSYVNYYVCNGAVIAAQFGDKAADGKAKELLQSLYPERAVEMLNIDPIGESGGGIHCATQQQPRAG